jgi:Tol biopolymer transport system component
MSIDRVKQKLWRVQWLVYVSLVVALVIPFAGWPRTARADWHSLSGLLPEFSTTPRFVISPDSRTVAFVVDKDSDDVEELYAVPISGTNPIKLNPPLVNGGDVLAFRFAFTPDSQAVIYLADQEVDNRVEMFRVPVMGGEAVKLSPPLVAGGNIGNFEIDTKNGRIVYLADQETNEMYELWSIPLAGGQPTKLNGALAPGGNVGVFRLDPLSNRVVYTAEQEINGKYELYSAPVGGGSLVKLSPPIVLTGGGDVGIYDQFAVNPVVPVVVFIAREAGFTGGRLYMVPTAGGELTQLSFNLLSTQRLLSFRISPAGDRVVFNVGTKTPETNAFKGKLYSNLIGGGGPADVSETPDPLFGTDNYRIMPDGSHVVYTFQNNAATPVRLESATLLGVRTPLYVPDPSESLFNFDFSPDSDWVIYQESRDGSSTNTHAIPPTGGSATNFGSSNYKAVTLDSARIAYTRIVTAENHTDLFSAQIFGGDERNLSGSDGAGFIGDVKISPDNQWIVFGIQIDGRYDLRVSDGAAAQPTPTITPTPTPTETPTSTMTPTPTNTPAPTTTTSSTTPMLTPTPTGTLLPTSDTFSSHLPSVIR